MSGPQGQPQRRDRATVAAGAAILLAGAVIATDRLGGPRLDFGWAWPLSCLVAGCALLARSTGAGASAGLYAGVIARVAGENRRLRAALRAAVVLTAPLCGAGPAAYAVLALWQTLAVRASRRLEWRRSAATGMLGLAALLAARAAGLVLGPDSVLWPIVLAGAGLPLLWGASRSLAPGEPGDRFDDAEARTWLGLILTIAAAGLVLDATGLFRQAAGTIAGTAVAALVLGLLGGPRWWRTSRLLAAERVVRARAEERAEVAGHLHDSVLQTLALIQRRARDPSEVVGLARRQERELREWLASGAPRPAPEASLATALRAAAASIEDDHGVRVEVVTVGDRRLEAAGRALVAAAREALANAAKHGGGAPVSLFAEIESGRVSAYVRDRGRGFDPAAVPPDRAGLRESIIARMERAGGRASVRSAPGEGCEVELELGSEP